MYEDNGPLSGAQRSKEAFDSEEVVDDEEDSEVQFVTSVNHKLNDNKITSVRSVQPRGKMGLADYNKGRALPYYQGESVHNTLGTQISQAFNPLQSVSSYQQFRRTTTNENPYMEQYQE